MVQSKTILQLPANNTQANNGKNGRKNGSNSQKNGNNKRKSSPYKKLVSMGRISKDIINELYSPIDATNRFINLALQTVEEDSQGRQFLLESKDGIRKTSRLLNRLNNYAKKLEKEIRELTEKK